MSAISDHDSEHLFLDLHALTDIVEILINSTELPNLLNSLIEKITKIPIIMLTIKNEGIDLVHRAETTHEREIHLTPTATHVFNQLARHCNQVLLHEPILSNPGGG